VCPLYQRFTSSEKQTSPTDVPRRGARSCRGVVCVQHVCVRSTSEKVVDVLQNYPLPVYRCAVKRYAAHCYVLTSLAKS